MDTKDVIRSIKRDLRLMMNGPASAAMRERGLVYKLNFGVEIPRIKEIAARYEAGSELASMLWKDGVRECRIMASILQPADDFLPDMADVWVEDIGNIELAEQTVMNLFVRLPYAPGKAFLWMADEREYVQTCGFLLAARLLMKGMELNSRAADELLDQAQAAMEGDLYFPRKAAWLAVSKFAEQSDENAKKAAFLLQK